MKKTILLTVLLTIYNLGFSQDSFINNETFENDSFSASIFELNDKYNVVATGINTSLSDVGSTFFMNKYIMYSTRKTGAIGAGRDINTGNPYGGLYCMNVDKTGNLSHPYFFASVLDDKGNEGGLAFSPNEKVVYYTNSTPENTNNYQLYKAVFDETCRCSNAWIKKEAVAFNSANYSIENPCVSSDGTKIYFSSNIPGGFGGYDLYVADIDENGMPVHPKNLGSEINTAKDEKFPFVTKQSELFFSSNGHLGYGGHDVFVSKVRKNSYSSPLNIGKTINTSADEVAFILASKTKGYVTSNRLQGLGSYDIYRFGLQKETNSLKGAVTEKISNIVLPNTKISLIDVDGNEVSTQMSDDKGTFEFEVTPLEKYTVVAKKEGYSDFELPIQATTGSTTKLIALDQKKAEVTTTNIVVENIYFEYNKASLMAESTLSLNKIYDVLMANPEMKISINAHSDSRGSEVYNLNLSDKRASSALNYLIKKGISKDRIVAKGYGETMLLSNCKSNCSEKEYETDRRVEFLIIK